MEYRRGGKLSLFPTLLPPHAPRNDLLLTVTAMGPPSTAAAGAMRPGEPIGGSLLGNRRLAALQDSSSLVQANKTHPEKLLTRRHTDLNARVQSPIKQLRAASRPTLGQMTAPVPQRSIVLPPITIASNSIPGSRQLLTTQHEQQTYNEEEDSSSEVR